MIDDNSKDGLVYFIRGGCWWFSCRSAPNQARGGELHNTRYHDTATRLMRRLTSTRLMRRLR